jgi:hypothetical protein
MSTWLLNFLPDWFFYVSFFVSIIVLIFTNFVPIYKTTIQALCLVVLLFSVYMFGVIENDKVWKSRVAELEAKITEAENKSAIETIKIVDKVVFKKQIIKEKGDVIIKYIDREIVKYDTKFSPGGVCEIPKEFIQSINGAAE